MAVGNGNRKKIVVVGLGMVGISFIEKLLKLDARSREYDILVFGEEPYLSYNRVGLTSFFEHRQVDSLYLKPREWVSCFSSNIHRIYWLPSRQLADCCLALAV